MTLTEKQIAAGRRMISDRLNHLRKTVTSVDVTDELVVRQNNGLLGLVTVFRTTPEPSIFCKNPVPSYDCEEVIFGAAKMFAAPTSGAQNCSTREECLTAIAASLAIVDHLSPA